MAGMTNTVTFANGAQIVLSATIADPDAGDLVAFVISTYPVQNDAQGNPLTRDSAWAVKAWWEGAIVDTLTKVRAWKQQQAAEAAAQAVALINVQLS